MDDDFNTGAAMSELFAILSALNRFADSGQLEDASARKDDDVATFRRASETLRELSGHPGPVLQATHRHRKHR